jgi:hypothetical protein
MHPANSKKIVSPLPSSPFPISDDVINTIATNKEIDVFLRLTLSNRVGNLFFIMDCSGF